MKKALQYAISLSLAGALLWYVFKDIDLAAMFERLGTADWRWIAASFAITFLAHVVRAWRWRMLMGPLGYTPSASNAVLAVLTGYFANYIVPRMGEVTRCGTLYRLEKVPVNLGFGTVVAERIFDVLTLLVLVAFNFLLEFDRLSDFFMDFFTSKVDKDQGQGVVTSWFITAAVMALLLVAVLAFMIYRNSSFREKFLANRFIAKVVDFGKGMLDGLLSIRRLKHPVLFVVSTVLIWVCYYYASYVLFFCVPETSELGMLAGLTLLVIGAIGMTAPTPGGIGAYHLLVGNVMLLYGLSKQDGIALATFVQGSQMILMLVLGALAFLIVLFKRGGTPKEQKEVGL
jgi:uncharacterized protein (TIRG00374 family)